MIKLNKCDLCGSNKIKFLFNLKDRMYAIKGEYSVSKCSTCELIFVNPQPSDKEVSKHYPKTNYYSFKHMEEPKITKLLYDTYLLNKKNIFYKIILFPFKQHIRSCKVVPNGRFLDVGCGNGDFLLKMKQTGMICYGVDPGQYDKKFAKDNDLRMISGTLKEAKYPSNYFDVITINHVFEHVTNPSEVLDELHRILKPNGTLILGTPETSSLARVVFGKYWVAFDIPRHLFLYSHKNIKQYAKKSNFKIVRTRYTSSSPLQFIGSTLYFTNKFRKNKVYLSKQKVTDNKFLILLLFPLTVLCNALRIGDSMEITMTKPSKSFKKV